MKQFLKWGLFFSEAVVSDDRNSFSSGAIGECTNQNTPFASSIMNIAPPVPRQAPLAAPPLALFDRLPEVMLEVVMSFTCNDLKELIKLSLIDKSWLLCTRQPWLHEKLELPRVDLVYRGVLSHEGMNTRLRHIAICVKGLRELDIAHNSWQAVNDEGLRVISSSFHFLTKLGFSSSKVTNWSLMRTLVKLEYLDTTDSSMGDAGLEHVCLLPKLQQLCLARTAVTNHGLSHISSLPNLKALDLSCNYEGVGDEGLEALAGLVNMETLDLGETGVTRAGLAHLASMSCLKNLHLDYTNVGDEGIVHLSKLTYLEGLYLDGTGINNHGVTHISSLHNLRMHGLAHNEGVGAEGLEALAGLVNIVLETLYVGDTEVTGAGVGEGD